MIISLRVAIAKLYSISGFGLAIAKTIGFSDMLKSISGVKTSAVERPKNKSQPFIASAKLIGSQSLAYLRCNSEIEGLSFVNKPLLLNMYTFSGFIPKSTYKSAQAIAAEPAPETTILISSAFLSANSKALSKAAEEIIAVPCWSSCITGIFNSSTNRLSISKDSGALISSRLIPPKVGAIFFTVSINSSTFLVPISISNTSISENILNKSPFPSITGFEASGPMSPSPKTAVPLVITATKLPFAVYL